VLYEVRPIELALDRVQWVIATRNGNHTDGEDWLCEKFAREKASDAELCVVNRELGVCG
jgi:hypothetical protein